MRGHATLVMSRTNRDRYMEQKLPNALSATDGASRPAMGPVERVARIADVIARSAASNESFGRLISEVVDKLHEQRLFRLLLPKVYGGEEVDPVTWFRTMEALAKLDGSTAWCVGQINGCSMSASAVSPEVARKIWGETRSALSWGPPIRSRADEVDGGHRVSGEWMMASGSRHATWIGLMAPVYDKRGVAVPLSEGTSTRIFFVPASAIEWIENWQVIGLEATNSGGFKVDNVFVPHGFSMNREHLLDVRLDSPLYKYPLNGLFSVGFSAVALGIARSMLDACIAMAEKKPRLAKTTLRDSHLVQFQIGEAEARLRSARGFVEATAGRVFELGGCHRQAHDCAAHRHPDGHYLRHPRGKNGRGRRMGNRRRECDLYLRPLRAPTA